MQKNTDIRILEVAYDFEQHQYRTPLKFGGVPTDHCVLLNVRVRVETRDGKTAEGFGSMPLGNVWAFPPRFVPFDQSLEAMKRLAVRMVKTTSDCKVCAHPVVALHGFAFSRFHVFIPAWLMANSSPLIAPYGSLTKPRESWYNSATVTACGEEGETVAQGKDVLFSTDNWVEIHRTTDEWEARLVQTTLANQQIRCKTDSEQAANRQRYIVLYVSPDDRLEALEVVSRIGLAFAEAESAKRQAVTPKRRKAATGQPVPRATPTAVESLVIAKREGIGEIVHHVGRGYELRVGNTPYEMVDESRWEEFTDFSAQRQEFAILLRHEYPSLFEWLKAEKLMPEFIRLVESTYREVPPPRPREQQRTTTGQQPKDATEARMSKVAKFGLWVALISLAGLVLHLPWYANLGIALIAATTGFVAKYQIDSSNGSLKGSLIAFLAIMIACVVIAATWRQHQHDQPSEPSEFKGMHGESAFHHARLT